MSEALNTNGDLPRAYQRRIDHTCHCFEAACMGRPRIEDFLDGWPEPARAALLRNLIRIEVQHRRRRGELCKVEDYHERFPDLDPLWLAYVISAAVAQRDTPAELRNGELKAAAAWVGILPPLQDCEILEVLGQGGMSEVYRARQGLLNREVAVKMICTHAGQREIALFQAEAESVARLKHPNIVQIHEIGERNGRPCLVLELVDGGSLATKLAGKPLAARAAAELALVLARVIHYAHQQGIIHCDLKPGNVLLTADGTPKIADFGVARHLGGGAALMDDAVVGTPSYMAPEQAAGRNEQIGPHTDVYALGAILYECLTGRPPFPEPTRKQTLRRVLRGAPIPPSMFRSRLHPDLETICLKCLYKAPRDRYASAQELADDLDRFLRGNPIRARPLTLVERGVRLVERTVRLDEISRWGTATIWAAAVHLLGHAVIFGLIRTGQPVTLLWLWLLVFEAMGLWLFWHLLRRAGQLTDSERDLRNLGVGFALTGAVLTWIYCPPFSGAPIADALHAYPPLAVVLGVLLFAEGRMFWGRLYLFGLAFFALAVLMRQRPEWSPLLFGGLHAATLLYLGLHGHRAARETITVIQAAGGDRARRSQSAPRQTEA